MQNPAGTGCCWFDPRRMGMFFTLVTTLIHWRKVCHKQDRDWGTEELSFNPLKQSLPFLLVWWPPSSKPLSSSTEKKLHFPSAYRSLASFFQKEKVKKESKHFSYKGQRSFFCIWKVRIFCKMKISDVFLDLWTKWRFIFQTGREVPAGFTSVWVCRKPEPLSTKPRTLNMSSFYWLFSSDRNRVLIQDLNHCRVRPQDQDRFLRRTLESTDLIGHFWTHMKG